MMMMNALFSFKVPSMAFQRRHGCNRIVMKAMKEGEKANLNFTLQGGTPATDNVANSKEFSSLVRILESTVPSSGLALLYNSPPTISDEAVADIGECFQIIQSGWPRLYNMPTVLGPDPKTMFQQNGDLKLKEITDLMESPRRNPSSAYLSLTPNIPNQVPPPLNSEGLIDLEAIVKNVFDCQYGLVYLDPVLGLGDMPEFDKKLVRKLRFACYMSKTLLVIDETICGLGRSGTLWAHGSLAIEPDVMLADFGRGMGVGAAVIHSTLSGASSYFLRRRGEIIPPRCINAAVVLLNVNGPNYEARVTSIGDYLKESLLQTIGAHTHVHVVGIRARGLILVVELNKGCKAVVVARACNELGLLVEHNDNIMPPAEETTEEQVDLAAAIMGKALVESY